MYMSVLGVGSWETHGFPFIPRFPFVKTEKLKEHDPS